MKFCPQLPPPGSRQPCPSPAMPRHSTGLNNTTRFPERLCSPRTSAASRHPGLAACRSRSRVSAVLTDMNHGFAQPAPPTSRHKQHLPPQGKNREGRDFGGHPDQTFHLQRTKPRVREISVHALEKLTAIKSWGRVKILKSDLIYLPAFQCHPHKTS